MFKFGAGLIAFGILSFVLRHFGREFIILMWIDYWGPKTGTAIRIGMIVLGVVLMGIGYSDSEYRSMKDEDE